MNRASGDLLQRLQERFAFHLRRCGVSATKSVASTTAPAIGRLYVINLDRSPGRWRSIRAEVARIRGANGTPLTSVTRRQSAVDAREIHLEDVPAEVQASYSLADQLFVQPVRALRRNDADRIVIHMTGQEVAVALSHIETWRRVAAGDDAYALILEDDAYFTRRFGRALDAAWADTLGLPDPDLLFLSYKEVDGGARKDVVTPRLFRPRSGLWQLSGYVLSRTGAQKLLDALPVRGPVDMWINHRFGDLAVYAATRPVIRQRPGIPSSNAYSVLPVLSAVGVLTREKPLIAPNNRLPVPVIASGPGGSGLTALATALSVLGYRCCSDLNQLPPGEHAALNRGRSDRVFDAYVNVGSLGPQAWPALSTAHPEARFIWTGSDLPEGCGADSGAVNAALGKRCVFLPPDHPDKWQALTDALDCDYPAHRYPDNEDRAQRQTVHFPTGSGITAATQQQPQRWDRSPWIVPAPGWPGLRTPASYLPGCAASGLDLVDDVGGLDATGWRLREDTFPGNLCLFRPDNVRVEDGVAEVVMRAEPAGVRQYTSGAIAAAQSSLYGTFAAAIRPPEVPGLITGMFLHRDIPRQEIDIEFLSKDAARMLVNVFYNPGCEGTRLQYGYRGTPVLIDLGFDASQDFHFYEIEWWPDVIRWRVDGRLVHERVEWGPTPIPDLPAEFNLNLWRSRSTQLAGRLPVDRLPARAVFRDVCIPAPQ